jgi:hypothetical protein
VPCLNDVGTRNKTEERTAAISGDSNAGPIYRATNSRFVIVRPFGRNAHQKDPNDTRAAAVEYDTGQVIVSDRPGLDVYEN